MKTILKNYDLIGSAFSVAACVAGWTAMLIMIFKSNS
jgi:hypothetical protein